MSINAIVLSKDEQLDLFTSKYIGTNKLQPLKLKQCQRYFKLFEGIEGHLSAMHYPVIRRLYAITKDGKRINAKYTKFTDTQPPEVLGTDILPDDWIEIRLETSHFPNPDTDVLHISNDGKFIRGH